MHRYPNQAEAPAGKRILWRSTSVPNQGWYLITTSSSTCSPGYVASAPTEATIVEWSPSGAYVKIQGADFKDHWNKATDMELIELLP